MLHRVLLVSVVVAGLSALAIATDGFRAVTAEGARRLQVEDEPRALPRVAMTDHEGRPLGWAELQGNPVLVEFIFTTCPDICQRMSSDFARLVRSAATKQETDIRFVSVSFDTERDTVAQLQRTARAYGADGDVWRFARIEDPAELAETLRTFGIVAIPSQSSGFEHNAAIHGIDSQGRLARIADVTETEEMLRWAIGTANSRR